MELPCFNYRKLITKFRCSDHQLEIEKGREERICGLCTDNAIQIEDYFLNKYKFYYILEIKHGLCRANITSDMINNKKLEKMENTYARPSLKEKNSLNLYRIRKIGLTPSHHTCRFNRYVVGSTVNANCILVLPFLFAFGRKCCNDIYGSPHENMNNKSKNMKESTV